MYEFKGDTTTQYADDIYVYIFKPTIEECIQQMSKDVEEKQTLKFWIYILSQE